MVECEFMRMPKETNPSNRRLKVVWSRTSRRSGSGTERFPQRDYLGLSVKSKY